MLSMCYITMCGQIYKKKKYVYVKGNMCFSFKILCESFVFSIWGCLKILWLLSF